MISIQMTKNQMLIYSSPRVKYLKQFVGFLLFNLLFSSIVFAQAKEPWEGAYTSPEFAGGAIRDLYCDLVGEVEGSFGALQFIVGGMMAFGYAVFGDTKKTYAIIAAGIVGATMSTGISLYFGKCAAVLRVKDKIVFYGKTIGHILSNT